MPDMFDHPISSAPTLDDVARHAGVSPATASRVLNGSARKVADSYRERVAEAARELGYTANLSAQAIVRGTSTIVALLVADIADPYFSQIAAGVTRGADEAGMVVTIATTDRNAEREASLVRTFRGQRPRGVILAASRDASASPDLDRELEALRAAGGRAVVLGPAGPDMRSVVLDNRGGARALGAAVAGRGYRSGLALVGADGVRTSDDRLAGVIEGFASGGGRIERTYRGQFGRESGADMMRAALSDGVPPGTAVFAASDVIAVGAMAALREAGRAVGADVAVAGFDDIALSVDVTPSLSTVHVPLEEVGYQLLRAVADEDWDPDAASFELAVILRDSTPVRS